ncbi:CGG triplet repeat-binding protein 1, partial [Astathelohania contejeani]
MAKNKQSKKEKAQNYATLCKKSLVVEPNDNLFCRYCNSVLNTDRKSNISSHLITKQHKDNIATETNKIYENGFLNFPKKSTADIILKRFTEANIPLYKIRNKSITKMFEALNITLPCETSLRSKVEELANKKRETMKNILKDQ